MKHWVGILIVMSLVLTGCTTIATSGPVEEVPMSAQPPGIDIAPEPPQEGITPTRLIEGFLQAMADPDGDYAVARQYLTHTASAGWRPEGAIVYDGVVTGDAESAEIDGQSIGIIDSSGHYDAGLALFRHNFALEQEDGQWRIGIAPEAILLSRYIFERYYSQVNVYYFSSAGSLVVPEPIHMPETAVTPNSIVQALLDGPSATISRAVSTSIPSGVSLAESGAVMDSQGVVTVAFDGLSGSLGDDARRRIGAQLIWSLSSIPRVTGLVVTNGGSAYTMPDANARGVLELSTQQGYQILSRAVPYAELFGISEGVPGIISDEFQTISAGAITFSEIAVSLEGTSIALIDDSHTGFFLGPSSGNVVRIETGLTNLRQAQFVSGAVWLLGDDASGRSQLVRVSNGEARPIPFNGQSDTDIKTFSVSPTGTRIALVLGIDGQPTLGLGTVIGDEQPQVVGWRALPMIDDRNTLLHDTVAVTWPDETSIAFVASSDGQVSVYSSQVDGSLIEDLSPFSGKPVEVTALARQGGGPIAIRTDAGAVWRYEPRTRWTKLADGFSAIAFGG